MKTYAIIDNIFLQSFTLIVDVSSSDLKKYIDEKFPDGKLEIEPDIKGCYFYSTFKAERHFFLWLKEFKSTISDQATLAHELIHHLTETFKDRGIPITDNNSETMAYYFEYIYKKVLSALKPTLNHCKKTKICRNRKKK